MTLHEAIEKLLQERGRPMTTSQIADELNRLGWYTKKDNSSIDPFQIHGRTKNYPQLFNRDGSTVSLKGTTSAPGTTTQSKLKPEKPDTFKAVPATDVEKRLMDKTAFKAAHAIDHLVPHLSGMYCIRLADGGLLPEPFHRFLTERGHDIIYIGIATESLNRRFLNQELRAKGHGTFFRSVGAMLGFLPPKGSLVNKANKRNYKFSSSDEQKIITWINSNFIVNWVAFEGNKEGLETVLIQKYKPLINLAKNPSALKELSDRRAVCVRVANGEIAY